MELNELEKLLDRKFDEKLKPIYDRLDGIDGHLDVIESRFDKLESMIVNLAINASKDNVKTLAG